MQQWFRKLHTFYQSLHNSNVLVAWLAGTEAQQMETLPDEEIIQRCTGEYSIIAKDQAIYSFQVRDIASECEPYIG